MSACTDAPDVGRLSIMADNGQTEGAGRAPWTIKGMDVETREVATRSARKRGISVAAWMANAVQDRANLEAGDAVTPPRQTGLQNGQTDPSGTDQILALAQAAVLLGGRRSMVQRLARSAVCDRLEALRGPVVSRLRAP